MLSPCALSGHPLYSLAHVLLVAPVGAGAGSGHTPGARCLFSPGATRVHLRRSYTLRGDSPGKSRGCARDAEVRFVSTGGCRGAFVVLWNQTLGLTPGSIFFSSSDSCCICCSSFVCLVCVFVLVKDSMKYSLHSSLFTSTEWLHVTLNDSSHRQDCWLLRIKVCSCSPHPSLTTTTHTHTSTSVPSQSLSRISCPTLLLGFCVMCWNTKHRHPQHQNCLWVMCN